MIVGFALAALALPLPAQDKPETEVVVTGRRLPGSAVRDVEPLAVLLPDQIRALGGTGMKQLLERVRSLARGSDGEPPVFLLNGRRLASEADLYALPFEAIAQTEVLPEQEAARFGFPPTRQVVNFITKKSFRGATAQQLAGTTTEGGGRTNYAEATTVRIDGARRATLSVSHFRQTPVRQSQRDVAPDPETLYATGGNVTGLDGASLDPRLDALAGRPVGIAAVPGDPAARRTLGGYVAGTPAVTDIGTARTLVPLSDQIRVDGNVAAPLGRAVDGSLNLSMDAQRTRGLNGYAPALLTVPGASDALPFDRDVRLYRYFPEAVLRSSGTSLSLRAGATVQGTVGQWSWNVTGNYDRLRATSAAEQGVPLDALQRAVDAGADPLTLPDAATLERRLIARSRTTTGTVQGKAVASGPLARLPAGQAQVTVTADFARSASGGEQAGGLAAPDLSRTIRGASLAATIPVASADEEVFAFLGRVSANGSLGFSDVSDYGRLTTFTYGLTWAPSRTVQVAASLSDTQSAPEIALLTGPILATPNTPVFDFVSGQSVLATVTSGGNPALAPQRRRIATVGAGVSPVRDRLQLRVDYVDTQARGQSFSLGAATPALQAAFPDQFRRDAAGRLVAVDLRPVNLSVERSRALRMTLNGNVQIGRRPAPPAPPVEGAPPAPPPPSPPPPLSLFATITANYRLDDRVVLRPGLPALDLLDGATLDGTGGRPRWDVDGSIGVGKGPLNANVYGRLQGPTRIRSDIAASDLRFSGRTWLVLWAGLETEKLVDRPWAKRLSLSLTVENLLNDRIQVRDATGAVPNRFQPALIDPLGRSVRLGLRKLF
jgi:hypothetical protein